MNTLISLLIVAALVCPFPLASSIAVLCGRTPAAAAYTATAATFAGDMQCWMELDGTDSAADGTTGVVSFWWKPASGNNDPQVVCSTNDRVRFSRGFGDNSLYFKFDNSSGVTQVALRQNTSTVASLSSTSGWSWVAASWNTAVAGSGYMYIANASTGWVATDCTTRSTDLGAAGVIEYTDFDFAIGDNNGGGSIPITGDLSEFYLDITQYRDLTSSSVRDQFYNSSTHKPAQNLSSYGSPILYLRGDGTGFTVNSGNGGNMTKKGTTALVSATGP